jgi:CSLREA domain-containing protein
MRLLVLLALLLLPVGAGWAAIFVVETTVDGSDANPGDGVCATLGDECTLRAAVEEANALPGRDQIQLDDAIHTRTIPAELDVTDDLAIWSPYLTATIDAGGLGRVLHVETGVSVTLSGIVLRHGADASAEGGGALLNEGTVTLRHGAIFENTAALGAGIRNVGGLTIEDVNVIYNGPGAAIVNDGSLTLTRVDIAVNDGIGLENRVTASLQAVRIEANAGTGIRNYSQSLGLAGLDMNQSVIAKNAGGGIYSTGYAYLRRTTVSGNRGGSASGIFVAAGYLSIENVTIAANGNAVSSVAALDGSAAADVRAGNSIVAGNFGTGGDPDCRVPVTSFGHNLMPCPLDAPDATTFAGDPRVAPLKEVDIVWPANMGRTLVHELLPGSPAIDTGMCTVPPDQRGGDRPLGAQCDIGALETIPLCTGGVGMTDTRLTVKRRLDGGGIVKAKGQLLFADPGAPALDPLADGLQLRVEDVSGTAGALVERTYVTEPLIGVDLGCEGWRARGAGRYRWRSAITGSRCAGHVGTLAVTLTDTRTSTGTIAFAAKAKTALPVFAAPLRVTVVLGAERFGGNAAGTAGACAVHVFQCTSDPAGTVFKCS